MMKKTVKKVFYYNKFRSFKLINIVKAIKRRSTFNCNDSSKRANKMPVISSSPLKPKQIDPPTNSLATRHPSEPSKDRRTLLTSRLHPRPLLQPAEYFPSYLDI
jgi:hypothetical protein